MAQDQHGRSADASRPLMAGEESVDRFVDEDVLNSSTTNPVVRKAMSFWNAGRLVQSLTLSAGISGLLFGTSHEAKKILDEQYSLINFN